MLCNTCKKSKICKEICRKLENYLERLNGKKGYTMRHMRRIEKSRDPAELPGLAMEALSHRLGHRNIKYIPENV